MELTHQLTPMLRTLRLSGILETLEVRNRQAVEARTSFVEFLALLLQDELERRAQAALHLRLRRAAFAFDKTLESFDSVQRRVMCSEAQRLAVHGLVLSPHST
jgi:DNA replication protein DnaC